MSAEWTGHCDPAESWSRVVYSDLGLQNLAPGTRIRELGVTGRTFLVGARPNQLWFGEILCHPFVLELPVEVSE